MCVQAQPIGSERRDPAEAGAAGPRTLDSGASSECAAASFFWLPMDSEGCSMAALWRGRSLDQGVEGLLNDAPGLDAHRRSPQR
jgi:hypothetical protein